MLPDLIDLPAERAVLGAAFLEARAAALVAEADPTIFYSDRHRLIAESLRRLVARGDAVDLVAVRADLQHAGAWRAEWEGPLAGIAEDGILAMATPEHLAHLRELAGRRALVRVTAEAQTAAQDVSIPWSAVIERLLRDAAAVERGERDGYLLPEAWYAELQAGQAVPRLTMGLPVWDDGGGLTFGDLHLLAARPGLGKTMVALQIAHHVSHVQGLPVLFISAEMSRQQIGQRLRRLSGLAGLADSGLLIADPAGPTIEELGVMIRRAHATHAVQLVIVDHLQEVAPRRLYRDRRDLEIREITVTLRDLVKRLGIVGLALSQLNRDVESRRASPKPMLSDLRDGGALEEQAASVTFLWSRAENPEEDPLPITLSLRKNRHGRLRDWEGALSRAEGRVR